MLADGSPARPPPVALEDVDGPTVASRARVLSGESVERGSPIASCIGPAGAEGASVVERIGVLGASVTLLGARGRELRGCDAITAGTTRGSRWCGRAYARLHEGRLRDPRLSLSCRDAEGEPVGFSWVQPDPATSYVVVARPAYDEVYPTAGDLPVRIATADVDLATASSELFVSEHARDGRRLRAYELEARVSG
jgi:hypothetical protein